MSIERLVPKDADGRARDYLALFVRGQADSATARLVPPLQVAQASTELRKIGDLLRNERFDTTRVIGAQINTIGGIRHANLSYELHSSFSWFLANVATVDSANTWFVEGVSVRTIPEPLEQATEFARAPRTFAHYLWLILMLSAVTTSVGTAVFLVTRREMPRRWLWTLLALIGVGAFSFNWTSGAVGVNPLTILLLSTAVVRSGPAAPWVFTFAIPAGAIAGIVRYRRWRDRVIAPAPDLPVSSSQAAI